ncbi:MAG: hypothetical protein O3B73_06695 [bacterium]|nr:hypothetical protein [bacterium]
MAPGSEVVELDLDRIDPSLFSEDEVSYVYHLKHLSTVANAVVMSGENRGFIDLKVWRRPQDNKPYNARILENQASLAFFYTEDRPWNPYFGDAALRARLEAILDFWCRSQHTDGRFSEYAPEQWSLAPTGFGIKFMGETLRRLRAQEVIGGPGIDAALFQRTVEAARKAIHVLLTHTDLLRHATNYSNQYTGFWGGLVAFLSAFPDPELEGQFAEMVRTFREKLTSPVGYHYERSGCDWQYTLGTHRNNIRDVWKSVGGTEVGTMVAEMERPWVDWLSYNAVLEPDGTYFTLNRAIETRTGLPGFATWETPIGHDIELARAFSRTDSEYLASQAERKARMLAHWPAVAPLESYSPHIFVDGHPRFDWHPSLAQREGARRSLPYLASDRFTAFRMDDRFGVHFQFIRRPAYYAAFQSGEVLAPMQRYGLGLVWHPRMGTLLQTQSRDLGPWGTSASGADVYEAEAFEPDMTVGEEPFLPEPGKRLLGNGDLMLIYLLGERGQKVVRFAEDHIEVTVDHAGAFEEHLPLLTRADDRLVVEGHQVRLRRGGEQMVISFFSAMEITRPASDVFHGPFTLNPILVNTNDRLQYRIHWE